MPSVLLSSSPGVSVITTGPNGKSSIVFFTGSVVVPLISETIAIFCEVIAFIRLDFPALQQPNITILALSPTGVVFIFKPLILEPEIPCICSFYFTYILCGLLFYYRVAYLLKLGLYHLHSVILGIFGCIVCHILT